MSLLDILEFEAPLSRVEEILQNILGASNEVDPESRVEKLLQNLIEVAYEVDPDSRVELLLDNLLGGHNEVVPMSRVEMLIANALGESYDVVPQSRVEERGWQQIMLRFVTNSPHPSHTTLHRKKSEPCSVRTTYGLILGMLR